MRMFDWSQYFAEHLPFGLHKESMILASEAQLQTIKECEGTK